MLLIKYGVSFQSDSIWQIAELAFKYNLNGYVTRARGPARLRITTVIPVETLSWH